MTFPPPVAASAGVRCPQCGADIAPAAVSCPDCHALIHAGQLKSLADAARTAAARGDVSGQLEAWRVALTLLPPESAQFRTIRDRVQAMLTAKMTLTQVQAANPTQGFTTRYGSVSSSAASTFVESIYTSLSSQAKKE